MRPRLPRAPTGGNGASGGGADPSSRPARAWVPSTHGTRAEDVPDLPGRGGVGPEGTVEHAVLRVAGHELSCSDSPIDHEWGFTPAVSLWVDCDDAAEQERLFERLGEGGRVYMPLDGYGFSTRFGWVGDRFGVTWQLNLP